MRETRHEEEGDRGSHARPRAHRGAPGSCPEPACTTKPHSTWGKGVYIIRGNRQSIQMCFNNNSLIRGPWEMEAPRTPHPKEIATASWHRVAKCIIHAFTHSFDKYLLSTHYLPGTLLRAGDRRVNRRRPKSPTLWPFVLLGERQGLNNSGKTGATWQECLQNKAKTETGLIVNREMG